MVCFLHFLKRLHQESEKGDLAGAMASYQTDIFNGKNLRDGDSDLKHRQSSLYSMLLNCENRIYPWNAPSRSKLLCYIVSSV